MVNVLQIDNIMKKVIKKLLEIFEEDNGVLSSMRVYSFVMLVFTICFDTHCINKGKDITWEFIMLNLVFLIAIFVPKYLQKLAELKFGK